MKPSHKLLLLLFIGLLLLVVVSFIVFQAFLKIFILPINVKTEIQPVTHTQRYTNNKYSIDFPENWKVSMIGSDAYPSYTVSAEPMPNPDHVLFSVYFTLHRRYESLDPKAIDLVKIKIDRAKKDSLNFQNYTEQTVFVQTNTAIRYEYDSVNDWIPNVDFGFDKFITIPFNYIFNRNHSGVERENWHLGGVIFVTNGDAYEISFRSSTETYGKYKQTFDAILGSLNIY